MIPPLVKAYDATPAARPAQGAAGEADRRCCARWDYRWGDRLRPDVAGRVLGHRRDAARGARGARGRDVGRGLRGPAGQRRDELLASLAAASDTLTADFGTWQTPWGDINRFQRINDDIDPHFDDAEPSIPVPFTSSVWGSLASFGARAYPNTKKWYGTSGNSFVAVVEFGDSVRARAVTAGGESGDVAFAALRRRGRALRHREPARRVLLPVAAQGTHRARVPPRRLMATAPHWRGTRVRRVAPRTMVTEGERQTRNRPGTYAEQGRRT